MRCKSREHAQYLAKCHACPIKNSTGITNPFPWLVPDSAGFPSRWAQVNVEEKRGDLRRIDPAEMPHRTLQLLPLIPSTRDSQTVPRMPTILRCTSQKWPRPSAHGMKRMLAPTSIPPVRYKVTVMLPRAGVGRRRVPFRIRGRPEMHRLRRRRVRIPHRHLSTFQ